MPPSLDTCLCCKNSLCFEISLGLLATVSAIIVDHLLREDLKNTCHATPYVPSTTSSIGRFAKLPFTKMPRTRAFLHGPVLMTLAFYSLTKPVH